MARRTLTKTVDGETEDLPDCSVEVGESAKGEFSIKSVKAYGATVLEAGNAALAEFKEALARWETEAETWNPAAAHDAGGLGGCTGSVPPG